MWELFCPGITMSILSGNHQPDWKQRRDAKVESGAYDVSVWCDTCMVFIDEKVPGTRIPTIVDRKCGIIYEWSYLAERWFKHDIRDWTIGREVTPKGEASKL